MKPNQHNIDTLQLLPCEACNVYEDAPPCEDHWPVESINAYTHFLIDDTWYTCPYKYKAYVGALLTIEDGMNICGRLDYPKPSKIKNLTDLLTLCLKQGVTDDTLIKYFPEEQIKRMKGRVFKKLVKGK